ncbi:MAG: hemolysin family protein [Planctomycetaceae bacterium]
MSEWLLATTLVLLAAADFLVLLAAFSLRAFSRGRLDEICKRRGRPKRFGRILKGDEDARLLCELAAAALTPLLVGLGVHQFDVFNSPAGGWWEWTMWTGLIVGLLLAFLLLLTVLPWTISRVGGERLIYALWPALGAATRVFSPVLRPLKAFDRMMHRLTGREYLVDGEAGSITEEIRSVVDEGEREGLLENDARTMIHRVMELHEEDTAAIMTPRTEMVCVRADATLEEARDVLLRAGHSRVPVIGETTDDIVGILYAKDLLRHACRGGGAGEDRPATLKQIVREPYYVPETTGIDSLLEMMKRKRVHLAIVVDEYGGVAGLVSMEDILEEIVGEIVDEYDAAEETGIVTLSADAVEVDSRVHIDDLNDQFPFNLPEDADYDTVGGFVFHQLGRVPESGEAFTQGQVRVTVQKADKRRIHNVRLERDASLAERPADSA